MYSISCNIATYGVLCCSFLHFIPSAKRQSSLFYNLFPLHFSVIKNSAFGPNAYSQQHISHSIELSLALIGKHKADPAHKHIAAEWLIHRAERMDALPPSLMCIAGLGLSRTLCGSFGLTL